MMKQMRATQILAFLVTIGIQTQALSLWAKANVLPGERIVCETSKFEHDSDGEVFSSTVDNPRGEHLSFRVIPTLFSKLNRVGKIDLSQSSKHDRRLARLESLKQTHALKKPRHLTKSETQKENLRQDSLLKLDSKLAFTPLYQGYENIKGHTVRVAHYGVTLINEENELALLNDEYARSANIFSDAKPRPYTHSLSLYSPKNLKKQDRLAPHIMVGVLTANIPGRPLPLELRCFARGI